MRVSPFVVFSIFTLIGACSFGPSEDAEVKAAVSRIVEAEELVAVYNFGQIVVNMNYTKAFEMEAEERMELARRIAHTAVKIHPDSSVVMVAFGRVEPDIQQIAYAWEHHDGSLTPIGSEQ